MQVRERGEVARPQSPTVAGRFGFWIVTCVLGLFLAAASAPTPLYGIYATRWHFKATTLTAIFAVYAIALLATLLLTGSLSDSIGRRPVILAALGLQALAIVMFIVASGVIWLYAARILQGVATGLVTAAVSASLIDLQPRDRPGLGPLMNAVIPTVGLAVGGLVAGALVQYAPSPLRLTYIVLLAGFVLLSVAMLAVPEPVPERRPISFRPRVGVEPALRSAFWAAVPCLIAAWALGGLYLSLGPSVILDVEKSSNHLLGGSIVFALCGAGALASLLFRAVASEVAMILGCALLVGGLVITVFAVAGASGMLLFVGSIISGAGFGVGFLGAFRTLVAGATTTGRSAIIATIYIVAYLAFALPAVIGGILTTHFGLKHTTIGYAVVVALLASAALIAESSRMVRLHRSRQEVPSSG